MRISIWNLISTRVNVQTFMNILVYSVVFLCIVWKLEAYEKVSINGNLLNKCTMVLWPNTIKLYREKSRLLSVCFSLQKTKMCERVKNEKFGKRFCTVLRTISECRVKNGTKKKRKNNKNRWNWNFEYAFLANA